MTRPDGLTKYAERQQATNAQAVQRAAEIIKCATGKPIDYYATRSRKSEQVAYRALFVYLAVELGASYVSAGKALGRSHATAIHSYDNYTQYATTWEPLAKLRDKVIRYTNRHHDTNRRNP